MEYRKRQVIGAQPPQAAAHVDRKLITQGDRISTHCQWCVLS